MLKAINCWLNDSADIAEFNAQRRKFTLHLLVAERALSREAVDGLDYEIADLTRMSLDEPKGFAVARAVVRRTSEWFLNDASVWKDGPALRHYIAIDRLCLDVQTLPLDRLFG